MDADTLPVLSFLCSYNGSAMRYLVGAMQDGRLPARCGVIIVNNRDSSVFDWAREQALNCLNISSSTHPQNEDVAIESALTHAGTDFCVLSGYMKRLGPETLTAFSGRILNVHPSLLPRHGGQGMYGDRVHQAVLDAGDTESGATIHRVSSEYDEGPILKQQRVPVLPGDTLESLRQRVQAVEPALYLSVLQTLLDTPQTP